MSEESLERRVETARRREMWRRSEEYRKAQLVYWIYAGTGGLLFIVSFVFAQLTAYASSTKQVVAIIGLAIVLFIATLALGVQNFNNRKRRFEDAQLIERYGDIGDETAKLLDEDKLVLGTLWKLSEERLRVYHEIATRQANASFRNAQWAITAGFIVIIVGASVVFFARNETVTIVVGILSMAGGALSAYIGKTFLRLQESAASHLRSYFDQPREQFRYLAAERLFSYLGSDDQKFEAVKEIVRSMSQSNLQP